MSHKQLFLARVICFLTLASVLLGQSFTQGACKAMAAGAPLAVDPRNPNLKSTAAVGYGLASEPYAPELASAPKGNFNYTFFQVDAGLGTHFNAWGLDWSTGLDLRLIDPTSLIDLSFGTNKGQKGEGGQAVSAISNLAAHFYWQDLELTPRLTVGLERFHFLHRSVRNTLFGVGLEAWYVAWPLNFGNILVPVFALQARYLLPFSRYVTFDSIKVGKKKARERNAFWQEKYQFGSEGALTGYDWGVHFGVELFPEKGRRRKQILLGLFNRTKEHTDIIVYITPDAKKFENATASEKAFLLTIRGEMGDP